MSGQKGQQCGAGLHERLLQRPRRPLPIARRAMRRDVHPIAVPDRPFVMAPARTDHGDRVVVAGGGQMPTPLSVFRRFVLIARHAAPPLEQDAADAQPHAKARIVADGEAEGRSIEAAHNTQAPIHNRHSTMCPRSRTTGIVGVESARAVGSLMAFTEPRVYCRSLLRPLGDRDSTRRSTPCLPLPRGQRLRPPISPERPARPARSDSKLLVK